MKRGAGDANRMAVGDFSSERRATRMPRKSCFAMVAGLLLIPLIALADPQSFQKPYYMDQIPIITGTVESVTDHSFNLVTDAGEHMTFEMDSHTLLPAKFGPESRVWMEYSVLDNGDHRALRVSSLGTGSLANTANEQAQAEYVEPQAEPPAEPPVAMQETPPAQEPPSTLPTTASPWPIVQLVGALAVGSGATLWFTRRRRTA